MVLSEVLYGFTKENDDELELKPGNRMPRVGGRVYCLTMGVDINRVSLTASVPHDNLRLAERLLQLLDVRLSFREIRVCQNAQQGPGGRF